MRATILALSTLLGLALCVMQEVSAEKPDSNQANISIPAALSKRGGKSHKHGKGHHGKHGHHSKGGSKKDSEDDKPKGDGDLVDTVAKTLKSLPGAFGPTLEKIKLPSGAIVLGVSLSWFQGVSAKVHRKNGTPLHKRRLNIHKRTGQLLELGNLFSQSGAQTSGSPVQMVQIPGAPAGSAPPPGGFASPPPGSGGGGGGGAPGGGSPPPGSGLQTLPTIPTVNSGPLPVPAAPVLGLPLPKTPTLPGLPTLPDLPPLPGSDEIVWPDLNIFGPKED
ncbi:hypothetical protein K501DRAFT_271337 [Backusella circina FSU 941]|nr:hypothetical protein K501DRAFT_271337 [Backusella circina FSU 941]